MSIMLVIIGSGMALVQRKKWENSTITKM